MLKNVFTLDKMGVQFGVCTASIEQLEFERRREANYKKYNIPSGLFASQNSFYTNDKLDDKNYIESRERTLQLKELNH